MTLFKNLNLCAQLKLWKMSRNLWSKEFFLLILDVLFIGKSAGVLIIIFLMKNSALVWLTHLLRAIYLLLLYALKHVFLLSIDENVSCIFFLQKLTSVIY